MRRLVLTTPIAIDRMSSELRTCIFLLPRQSSLAGTQLVASEQKQAQSCHSYLFFLDGSRGACAARDPRTTIRARWPKFAFESGRIWIRSPNKYWYKTYIYIYIHMYTHTHIYIYIILNLTVLMSMLAGKTAGASSNNLLISKWNSVVLLAATSCPRNLACAVESECSKYIYTHPYMPTYLCAHMQVHM